MTEAYMCSHGSCTEVSHHHWECRKGPYELSRYCEKHKGDCCTKPEIPTEDEPDDSETL